MAYVPTKIQLSGGSGIQPIYRPAISTGFDIVKAMPQGELKAHLDPPTKWMMESIGYKDKPSSLTYDVLYSMSVKNSIIGAIINTRINQVSSFTKPYRFNSDNLGFEIRLRDKEATPTESQKSIITSLEKFVEQCGYQRNPRRDDFDTFVRKTLRDSLVYDQLTFEILRDRWNRPAEVIAVDASTIRVAVEDFQYEPYMGEKAPTARDEVAYVQVIDGQVVAWFTAEEMAFNVRNPRTSIYLQPYGFSELEQLITQITSHLYAEQYNSKFFSQGGTTKGILNIKQDPNGVMNNEQLESFKRQWRAQVSGMTGAWKTPILQAPGGLEYINVSQSNRDMEFDRWMTYLVNIVAAIYQIDPAEINFANNGGVSGNGSGIFEGSNESKLKNSKDKGLRPLLRFMEDVVNKNIISAFSDEFTFTFRGIDEQSEVEKIDLDSKAVKTFKTVNEIRQERGFEPLEGGDTLLDPSWMNMQAQAKMMEAQGGEDDIYGDEVESAEGNESAEGGEYDGYGEEEEVPTEEEPGGEYDDYFSGYENTEEPLERSLSKAISRYIIEVPE